MSYKKEANRWCREYYLQSAQPEYVVRMIGTAAYLAARQKGEEERQKLRELLKSAHHVILSLDKKAIGECKSNASKCK